MPLTRNYRSCLDLDQRLFLDQIRNAEHCHRRVVLAHDIAPGSTHCRHIVIVPNRAAGSIFRDGRQSNEPPLYSHNPGGAFMFTISDMVRWEAALSDTTLISRESQDLMWTPATLADGTSTGYGYGWSIEEVAG